MLAFCAILNITVLAGAYLIYPGYVDTGEPNIVALAWRLLAGHPVYLPIDDAARITNLYGPYLYLMHAAVFGIFGAGVAIGKAPGIVALLLALLLVGVSQARRGWPAAACALCLASAIVVLNLPATIWDRPETFMLMSVAAGVCVNNLSHETTGKWLRVVLFGLLIGIVIGLKVFAAIYFLPFGLMMLFRDGIAAAAVTVTIAFAVTALPFLTPVFNLQYLLDLVGVMADKPNSLPGLMKVFRYALYYVLPPCLFVAVGWRHMDVESRRRTALLGIGVLIAVVLVMYPAQKPGAGMYYLVPFAPLAFDLAARGLTAIGNRTFAVWTAACLCAVMMTLGIPVEKRFVRSLDWETASAVAAEIAAIEADFPSKTIEIGIGDNNDSYRRTYQRTRLVFDGHPYSLDTSIVIDTTAWGIELTPATLSLIDTCATDIWLIPAGERPFNWIGYYGKDTYGQPFRDSFMRAYAKSESRKYFDIYTCRRSE